MTEVAYGLSLGLALTFAWAGIAKLRNPRRTARAFDALGVPTQLARIVPVIELALAVGLVLHSLVAIVALLLLAVFTIVLVNADDGVTCACFGSGASDPVSWVQVLRNLLLMGVAAVASFAQGELSIGGMLAAAGVYAIVLLVLSLADLKRRTGVVLALDLP